MVGFHFDPSPRLWATSLGISVVIGVALLLSVSVPGTAGARFCPRPAETGTAVLWCAAFLGTVLTVRRRGR